MNSLDQLIGEVQGYISLVTNGLNDDHLYTNYQRVTSFALRLTEIRNQIAELEIKGEADTSLKKFRTMILDPTIERFDKIATYESRKITARKIELDLER